MAEIALPTYGQSQSIIDNQLNSMEFHSINVSVTPESYKTVLDISGAGILLVVAKSTKDAAEVTINVTPDGGSTSDDMFVGGTYGGTVTLLIPFNNSLQVKTTMIWESNTTLGINYLLK